MKITNEVSPSLRSVKMEIRKSKRAQNFWGCTGCVIDARITNDDYPWTLSPEP